MLAVSQESESLVEKYVQANEIPYPVAAGFRGKKHYSISGLPGAVLVSHEGLVLWQGISWELSDKIIDKALVEVAADLPWEPGERHEILSPAVKRAREGKLGAAWKVAEGARNKAAGNAEAIAAIDQFLLDISERGSTRTGKAMRIAESGRYYVAIEFLDVQAKIYQGTPLEKEWKSMSKAWLKDKECKLQYTLDKKRVSVVKKAYKGDPGKAVKGLLKLREKAQGLPIATAISADLKRVKSM